MRVAPGSGQSPPRPDGPFQRTRRRSRQRRRVTWLTPSGVPVDLGPAPLRDDPRGSEAAAQLSLEQTGGQSYGQQQDSPRLGSGSY
jgi:hypothetical protein